MPGNFVRPTLAIFYVLYILTCNGRLREHKSRHHSKIIDGKEDLSRFTAPQLSHKEKLYLAKIEDSLTSKRGRLIFTNSWAVQLNPAEVASADQIAKRNNFQNMGQV